MTILEIENLSKVYNAGDPENELTAIEDIDFTVAEGEFVSIIGPTGCGKSTLIEIIAGLIEPTTGEARIRGEPITAPREDIELAFQEETTLPWRTTMENVTFGLEMAGVDRETRRERGAEIVDMVGLTGFENHYPRALSGGMKQRASIGRSLAMNPDVMLMDEPFGALDEQTRLILGEELLDICEETGQTTVFVTHSLTEAAMLSHRVFVMSPRPGTFVETVEVDIPWPRSADLITADEFSDVTDQLWRHLRQESKTSLRQEQ